MPRFRRLVAVALVLALTSSWALAAPRHSRGEVTAAASPATLLLSRFWEWMTALWTKAGCGSDPSGICTGGSGTAPAPPEGAVWTKAGCGIDPSGICAGKPGTAPAPPDSHADEGCIIDPDGGPCGS